jgi:hypothetical protein
MRYYGSLALLALTLISGALFAYERSRADTLETRTSIGQLDLIRIETTLSNIAVHGGMEASQLKDLVGTYDAIRELIAKPSELADADKTIEWIRAKLAKRPENQPPVWSNYTGSGNGHGGSIGGGTQLGVDELMKMLQTEKQKPEEAAFRKNLLLQKWQQDGSTGSTFQPAGDTP